MFGERIREIAHGVGNRFAEAGNSFDPVGAEFRFGFFAHEPDGCGAEARLIFAHLAF